MDQLNSTGNDLSHTRYLLSSRLGIDTRALAAFRGSLGMILLLDLLLRARYLRMFYTNDGVLPVSVLAEQTPAYAQISLHALSGEVWFQLLLFSIASLSSIAMVIGYHTRIATGMSFILLLSLHARNPHILNGGDALLQHLMFWSLFLPLGSRWSVDANRRRQSQGRIVSVAGAAILIQILLVYSVNSVLKFRSELWLSGDAVTVILGLERFTVLLGPLLRDLPLVLETANWVWVGLLAASPLLVLLTGRLRITLVGAFATMHFGMLLTMDVGIFPLVSIIALIPFLPRSVWNSLEQRRLVNRLRTAASPRITLLSEKLLNGMTETPNHPRRRWTDRISQSIATLALVSIVLFNIVALGFIPVPAPIDDTLSGEHTESRWRMFAPHPPTTDYWYVAAGKLAPGDQVYLVHRVKTQGRDSIGSGVFLSSRLRKYMNNLRSHQNLQSPFAAYLCHRWNKNHDTELEAVLVYTAETPNPTLKDNTQERTAFINISCKV